MSDILSSITTRQTEQTVQAKPEQVRNAAGGFVYAADDDVRLHRFLTLGTDGSTYYTSAKDLTRENAAVVFRCVTNDPLKTVATIVEISTAGRAPKQNPALFALAIAASHASDEGRARRAGRVPAGLPHRLHAVHLRQVHRAVPWLGPWHAQGRRQVV